MPRPGGPWPDLSAYARQPARGPTMEVIWVAGSILRKAMLPHVGAMLVHLGAMLVGPPCVLWLARLGA